jgi:hypothetical protein
MTSVSVRHPDRAIPPQAEGSPMVRSFAALVIAASAGLSFASPAAAAEADFLKLHDKFPFLSQEQLLTTGYQACQASRNGVGSATIVSLVQEELDPLGVTVGTATDIVSTAIVQLDC